MMRERGGMKERERERERQRVSLDISTVKF